MYSKKQHYTEINISAFDTSILNIIIHLMNNRKTGLTIGTDSV